MNNKIRKLSSITFIKNIEQYFASHVFQQESGDTMESEVSRKIEN